MLDAEPAVANRNLFLQVLNAKLTQTLLPYGSMCPNGLYFGLEVLPQSVERKIAYHTQGSTLRNSGLKRFGACLNPMVLSTDMVDTSPTHNSNS